MSETELRVCQFDSSHCTNQTIPSAFDHVDEMDRETTWFEIYSMMRTIVNKYYAVSIQKLFKFAATYPQIVIRIPIIYQLKIYQSHMLLFFVVKNIIQPKRQVKLQMKTMITFKCKISLVVAVNENET